MKPALVISERDNVATALETLEPGRRVTLGSIDLTVRERIPHGHKVALGPIALGQPVIKYGSPIGLASADILAGAHVHVHNVASSRGRGDLDVLANTPEPRLAEPPDPGPRPADASDPAPRATEASETSRRAADVSTIDERSDSARPVSRAEPVRGPGRAS
jgi:SAF domain